MLRNYTFILYLYYTRNFFKSQKPNGIRKAPGDMQPGALLFKPVKYFFRKVKLL